jgi:anaerobic magnesium-protoporphyrin IX monomethyl ester cyclase
VAKRLRALSPGFETPIFYFKPYPGSSLTDEAIRDGYVPPSSLEEWSRFDFIGSVSPWLRPETHRKVERFKFYQRIAWAPGSPWSRPVRRFARWRLRLDAYGLPVEKLVSDWLWPQPDLS